MSYKYLLLEVADKVATVTIDRPDKGNALAPDVLLEVTGLFTELGTLDDVNVIVFTGGERYFSAGFDLSEIRRLEKVSSEAYTELFHRAYRAVLFCAQPTICAVRRCGNRRRLRSDHDVRHPLRIEPRQVRAT